MGIISFFSYRIYRFRKPCPYFLHEFECIFSLTGEAIVFSRRTTLRLDPVIGNESIIFESREQWIERTFDHDEPALFQRGDNI